MNIHHCSHFTFHNSYRNQKGFTLIETVTAMAISTIVLLAVGGFIVNMFRTTRSINSSLTAIEQARRAVLTLTDELRTASTSSTGNYPLAEVGTNLFTFYSDIDRDDYVERLRYFMDGNNLKRGYLKPSGDPLTYDEANEAISIVAQFVTNTSSIFLYYDTNYDGQTSPLVMPPNIPSIRLVRITLVIDQYSDEPPGPYELSSEVSIRSLKDNL